ncbi:MAG: hypothetical protein U1F57_11880 [bacterium]
MKRIVNEPATATLSLMDWIRRRTNSSPSTTQRRRFDISILEIGENAAIEVVSTNDTRLGGDNID